MATAKRTVKFNCRLIDRWYLTAANEDGGGVQQGRIIAEPAAGYYLVTVHSWVDGFVMYERLVHVNQMLGWRLYWTEERWRDAANETTERYEQLCRAKHPELEKGYE